jgi:hypothetical protein
MSGQHASQNQMECEQERGDNQRKEGRKRDTVR